MALVINFMMKTGLGLILSGVLAIGLGGCGTAAPSAAPAAAAGSPLVWKASPGQPTYYINSVASSADGSRIVGGTFFHSYSTPPPSGTAAASVDDGQSGTFGTYGYDRAGHQLWKDEFNGWQGVYWVDIAANGAYAASGGWFSQNPYAGFVRAFDAGTGQRLLDYRTANRVNEVALSSDGGWLISAAESIVLFRRSGASYQKAGEFAAPAVKSGSNYFVTAALSADGSTVVCADFAGHIMLLSAAGGNLTPVQQWALPSGYSHMVRLTPDGATFAAGGPAGSFYLFDTAQFKASGQPTVTYQTGSAGSVYSVAIADDGGTFVGVANYNSSHGMVYCVARQGSTGVLKWQYQTAHNPNCAWLNQAHGLLAVADGHPDGTPGGFYLLDAGSGALRWQFPTTNMSWPIMIAADASGIVAGSDDSNIYYFKP
jgi:WD40 repeat protein